MKKKDNIPPVFTAHDIERYHNGQLTAAEMHALEKAALEDPFLADALEGYSATPTAMAGDLTDLRQRLHDRVAGARRTRVLPLWSKIAAAIVIASGIGLVLYTVLLPKKDATYIAATTPPPAGPLAPVNKKDSITMPQAQSIVNANAAQQPLLATTPKQRVVLARKKSPADALSETHWVDTTKAAFPTATYQVHQQADTTAVAVSTPATNNLPPVMVDRRSDNNLSRNYAYTPSADKNHTANAFAFKAKVPGIEANNATNYTLNNYSLSGRVTDLNKKPLANAFISIVNTNRSVFTDRSGYFSLPAGDSNAQLSVSSVGFKTEMLRAYQLQKDTLIQLKENTSALADVVVVGYGAAKKKDSRNRALGAYRTITDSTAVEPLGGWDNFGDYLSQNVRVPEFGEKGDRPKGNVEVAFDVQADGTLTNIHVQHSLCGSCDTEAIRLLQEGPKWQVKKGRKAKASVTVKF